ncbi:MAG: hypothetical protein ACP5Q0_05295, partial [Halothiobacillus sp.]
MFIIDGSAGDSAAGVCVDLPRPDLNAPRVFPVQITRAAALLDLIQDEGIPSDRALAHAFRAERGMGKRDRTQLQVLVFFVLRYWRTLDVLMDLPLDTERGSSLPRLGVALALADRLDDTLAALTGVDGAVIARRLAAPMSLAARLNLRDGDMQRLRAAFGAEAATVGLALLARAPLDIRTNTRVTTPDALRAE